MRALTRTGRRRLRAPVTLQATVTDCGPAALTSLLRGFDLRIGLQTVRDASGTGIDGTSMRSLAETAASLGMPVAQQLVPPEHLLVRGSPHLPALVVVRQPDGFLHTVLAWRVFGAAIEIMDPGLGRTWQTHAHFLAALHHHTMEVAASAWLTYARSEAFLRPLALRLERAGAGALAAPLVRHALVKDTWRGLATLDATCRMVCDLRRVGPLRRGDCREVLVGAAASDDPVALIPEPYWSVRDASTDDGVDRLLVEAALIVAPKGAVGHGSR